MHVTLLHCSSLFLLFCLCNGQSRSTNFPLRTTSNDASRPKCDMLETRKFILDHNCISRSTQAKSALHELTAPSLEECQQACCDSREGSCDLVYWNSMHRCTIMNYYVLSLCPLLSPSDQSISSDVILLDVSQRQRVNSLLKKHLLRKGYRDGVRKLLGCSDNEFVCDNWDCIPSSYVCDRQPHCSDNSDEETCSKCLASNAEYVDVGSHYIPFNDGDKCKACICGNNSQPVYCYSATCHPKSTMDCFGPDKSLCCQCQLRNPEVATDSPDAPFANLSDTQRLIVSCMSVLVVITLLLFLSRNILHRGRRAVYHNHGYFSRGHHSAGRMSHSTAGRYWRESDTVSYQEHDMARPPFPDLPPAYNQLKPLCYVVTTNSEETLGPPPSYISEPDNAETPQTAEGQSGSQSVTREPTIAVEIPAVPTHPEASANDNQLNSAPVSPLSTTSESPLLSGDDVKVV